MDKPVFLTPTNQNTWRNHLLAPFFPRYKVLLELEKEPAHLRVSLSKLTLSHDRRFLFLRNNKCACTQTTQLLYAYGNHGEFYPGNVHGARRGIYVARHHWMDIKPVYKAHKSFFFTFVREPEKRAHSAFRNFFVDLTNRTSRKHMKPMIAHGYDPTKAADYNFDAFLDYIAHSFAIDRLNTDSHWRLQVDNIAYRDIRFDFIGRVENYEADISHVFEAGGAPGYPPASLLAARHNRSAASRIEVTPAQRARIRQLYAPDYEAFGY